MVKRHTLFTQSGVYVPKVFDGVVIFVCTKHPDPLFGVQVDTAQNAQRFSNVTVFDDNGDEVEYLEQGQPAPTRGENWLQAINKLWWIDHQAMKGESQ